MYMVFSHNTQKGERKTTTALNSSGKLFALRHLTRMTVTNWRERETEVAGVFILGLVEFSGVEDEGSCQLSN